MNFLKRLKEILNLFIYDKQEKVIVLLNYLTFFASIFSLGILIYYYGFPLNEQRSELLITMIKGVFVIYILNYLVRVFFSLHFIDFIKNNILEGVLIFLLVVDVIGLYYFEFEFIHTISDMIGIINFKAFYIIFIQLYIMLLGGIELINTSPGILNVKLKPALVPFAAFGLIIMFGTTLLMLPEMSVQNGSMRFIDALFTSVSATCVTGLQVVNTATFFTFKGQLIILLLMQLGGIGIVTFASFLVFFIKQGMGIRQQTVLRDYLEEGSWYDARSLIRQIIGYTFVIQLIGTMMIYSMWPAEMQFSSGAERLYFSIFHAVSAFCNAGFTLFPDGLMQETLKGANFLHASFAFLIIFGALGFPAIRDIFGINNLKERLRLPWMSWKTSTTIAVFSSIVLIIGGAIFFFILESGNSMADMNWHDKIATSFFQSVTTRTAGFNTIDIDALATPTLIIFLFLMFIGASSGGTGGGIKTSTFVVIMLSVYATIRAKKHIEFGRRTISNDLLHRAFSIFIFSSIFILIAVFALSISDPSFEIMQLVFEAVSAFCTVGLSTGITESLSEFGKTILIVSMYIGRLGTLTLAFALSSPVETTHYKYPNTHIIVG